MEGSSGGCFLFMVHLYLPVLLLLSSNNLALGSLTEGQIMAEFRGNISNWDNAAGAYGVEPSMKDHCQWEMISCDNTNRIAVLNLTFQQTWNISKPAFGVLAPSLSRLEALEELIIVGNSISGGLPEEWGAPGAFPSLILLQLEGNTLGGTLPDAWGTNGSFPSLKKLILGPQQQSVGQNTRSGYNGTLPSSWGTPGAFRSLRTLNVTGNNLQGPLPDKWAQPGAFPKLQQLYATKINMNGTLPTSWANMAALQELRLDENSLSGTFPAAWVAAGAFPKLEILSLPYNSLTGRLPQSLLLPSLGILNLQNNAFSGPLPVAFPPKLDLLNLQNNSFTGSLPRSWGIGAGLGNLSIMLLGGNQISGTLPSVWAEKGRWPYLLIAYLFENNIRLPNLDYHVAKRISLGELSTLGFLPAEWASPDAFPSLVALTLSQNPRISGVLPESWGSPNSFYSLSTLMLEDNQLSGTLPPSWGLSTSFSNLTCLSITNTRIGGPLPAEWIGFAKLKILHLSGNKLVGPLPTEWACTAKPPPLPATRVPTFPSLKELYLQDNALSGSLSGWFPDNQSCFPSLQTLVIANNNLSGTIPKGMGQVIFSDIWLEPGNHFCGSVPAGIPALAYDEDKCPDGPTWLFECGSDRILADTYLRNCSGSSASYIPGMDEPSAQANFSVTGMNVTTFLASSQVFVQVIKAELASVGNFNVSVTRVVAGPPQSHSQVPALAPSLPPGPGPGVTPPPLSSNRMLLTVLSSTIPDAEPSSRAPAGKRLLAPGYAPASAPAASASAVGAKPLKRGSQDVLEKVHEIGKVQDDSNTTLDITVVVKGVANNDQASKVFAVLLNYTQPVNSTDVASSRMVKAMAASNVSLRWVSLTATNFSPGASALSAPALGLTRTIPPASSPNRGNGTVAATAGGTGALPWGIIGGCVAAMLVLVAVIAIACCLRFRFLRCGQRGKVKVGHVDTRDNPEEIDKLNKEIHNAEKIDKHSTRNPPILPALPPDFPLVFYSWKVTGETPPPGVEHKLLHPEEFQQLVSSGRNAVTPEDPFKEQWLTGSMSKSSPKDLERLKDIMDVDVKDITFPSDPSGNRICIGQGAFGKVLLGVYKEKPVAVKFCSISSAEDDRGRLKAAQSLLREARLLHDVHDDNIIHFKGASIKRQPYFVLTEYMQLGTLGGRLECNYVDDPLLGFYEYVPWRNGKRVLNKAALKFALSLARGIQALHAQNIVHLDIKPYNILIAPDLTARITDVGISRVMRESGTGELQTLSDTSGTPGHQAPETKILPRFSEKSDIFSLGIVLYEMAVREATSDRGNQRIESLRTSGICPPELVDLIARCTIGMEAHARPDLRTIQQTLRKLLKEAAAADVPPCNARSFQIQCASVGASGLQGANSGVSLLQGHDVLPSPGRASQLEGASSGVSLLSSSGRGSQLQGASSGVSLLQGHDVLPSSGHNFWGLSAAFRRARGPPSRT